MPGFNVLYIVICILPGRLQFKDVVTSVQQEVDRLRNDGVKFIIALGHAGFQVDLSVGQIPGVDVVVGGHTNTFLYTGRSGAIATMFSLFYFSPVQVSRLCFWCICFCLVRLCRAILTFLLCSTSL